MFFSDTLSKEKNNHVTHNSNLEYIIEYYDNLNLEMNNMNITENIIYTDNCGNQYKCEEIFQVANFNIKNEKSQITHKFADKYNFKGPWDLFSKNYQDTIQTCETGLAKEDGRISRIANAWDLYLLMSELIGGKSRLDHLYKNWENQKNKKIKNNFNANNTYIGFSIDNHKEYMAKYLQYSHIVFVDRKNVIAIRPVKDIQKISEIQGLDNENNKDEQGNSKVKYQTCLAHEFYVVLDRSVYVPFSICILFDMSSLKK